VLFTLLTLALGLTMLVAVLATARSGMKFPRKTPRLELPGGDVDTEWAREVAGSTGDACDARVEYVTRGFGKLAVEWTYISFALPESCPFLLRLRRPEDISQFSKPNEAFRVSPTGFERTSTIEAAPADVAHELLKQAGLVRFLALAPKLGTSELRTMRQPGGTRRLVLCIGDTLYRNLLRDAVLAVVEIVRGLPTAYAEPRQHVDGDGPYRGMMVDSLEVRDRRAAQLDEFGVVLDEEL
jgi:hypothetical protein